MGPGEPTIRQSRESWIGCLIRLLASQNDQCDPSVYLFLRWLTLLLLRAVLSQMMPPATDGNASFLRAARAGNLEKVLDYLKGSIDINTSNANGLNALHLAAKEGHVNVVSELLKRGANVNATTKKGNSALHIASLAGQEEVVKLLVQKQANVNVQSQNGFTPLYMAAQENHDGVVRFLLANGANQSLATEDGFTPLAVALQQGHDKVVAVLLENDARGKVRLPALHIASKKDDCKAAALLLHSEHNPDVTSKSGFTPLHIAAHYGNSNIASLLLDKGADVNFPAKHQITPLHVAAKWGKSNMVKLLLEKGAKIDASTRDGLTPLHCAARSGHDQVVEQLLEKNAPITAKTKNGLAPLHMASQGDHVDSARILLYHKAPVDDVTVDYLTALHVAAHCGHVGVAKLLLDRRADPNARALNGFTPLHIACKKNRIKVVELLLKHGASIEATTESGLTPLHVASFMGCMNIVIYLIQHGANPDIPTVRGETPLHLAARANQTDIIRILLRNGAHVDAKARELQTALHIASRLGNADMVGLLLQHGAAVDAPTKDAYTPLHVAAREGQDEVAALLLDHGAALAAPTKKGFTPLHLAAKYGNLKVAQLLLQKDAPVDAQGKNGVTPLHVAAHYDHVNVALLLLEKGASPHSAARNGYTPLHVAARKDQMDIASSLLEYGAKPGAESRAGFTPLHLAAQEGHADLAALLVEHGADCDAKAKNGLTPMHLCAQEDRVEVATILAKHGASLDPTTKAGYTPLHVACHFGQTNMIRFLLRQGANVNATTSHGYTPLHQAAQQGHTLIINLLLEHRAAPNAVTNQGQTALAIAQRLGYISVVETLKVVTETIVTTTTTTVTEEKYRVVAPETMHETFMSDSEDEAAEDNMLGDQSFRYLTADEMKSLGDDSLPIDVTRDERITESIHITREPGHPAPLTQEEERLSPTQAHTTEAIFVGNYAPDNVDLSRTPIHAGSLLSWDGDSCSSAYVLSPTKRMWRESSKLKWKTFLVSFLVDARGGAMRGCRHSGVRVIIPPRKAQMPMRITCRYLRKEKLPHPPPLLEGEACASRILEVGPAGAKFLGPVILEVPHFASLRGKEREISILRSDNGETWKEHTLEASEEAVQEVLNESFEGEELSALEDLQTNRIVRILTTDFPQYFAVVSRTRQEVHAVGPEGGLLSSTVVPQVQAIFPEGALTKKIRVGLQAQPIPAELVTKLLGHRVAVSPIVTVEPRRRKFHKPITLTIPVPQAATKGMINQYAGDAPTLRLLCSITGGTNKAQWEDVTGSTPLTFVNDCVSFTTTVSARFWLMDCRQVSEATKFATELYAEAMHVPFMAKFVVFAKRQDPMEAQLRVFCMTDDKEDKTLESQEHFTEVAKSRDVEVLEKKSQYLEFGGNLVPVTKSGEQLQLQFQAFRENRLPFAVRVKDPHQEPLGRLAFMRQPRAARATEPPQAPLCNLNIALPEYEASQNLSELVTLEKKYGFVEETGLAKPELIHRADLRLSDIARELGSDWPALAAQLDVPEQDVASIRTECPSDLAQQALLMLRLWMKRAGGRATGNNLEKGLRMINREDIVNKCMFNVELVTDDVEKAVAKVHLDQSGFDTFREELGTPKDTSLKRDASLDVSYDEQDLMKEAESAEETSSETGSVHEKHTGSEAKVGEHVPDKSSQGADVLLPGKELPTVEGQEIIEKPGGVIEVIEVTAHELSKPLSSGLLSKVSKIPKKIFPRGSKSKSSDEDSPSPGKRELKETPGGIVEVVEVTKHDVAIHPESTHVKQVGTEVLLEPATSETKPSGAEGLPPTHITREIKEVPGGIVEVVRVTKHIVGKLPEDKGIGEPSVRTTDASLPWEAELAKDPSAVIKREVKETPEGHVEVVQVIRREASDVPFGSDFPGDLESDGTVSRRIETTVVDGKPTVIRRLVTTTSDGIRQVTEHIEQGAEDAGSAASSLFAKMGEFAKGLSSDDPSAVTTREVKQLPGGAVEVVSVTKRSSSSPETEITSQEQLQSSTSGSMHFAESAVGKPMEAKTTIIRREISGPETIVRTTTSVVTSATAPGSSKPELSADVLDKMFGAMEKPRVDDRLRDVLTAEGGYVAKREVTPEEAELLAQLFPEQSTGVAVYPPAGLVPEAAIIPEYRCMTTAEGAHHDPESKEKVLLKLGRALSQDDLDAPSPTQGEAAMTVAGLGEAVDTSDQVEEPAVEKLELARRESKRYSQEFEQDEPLPKAMGFKTKPSEETVVSSTQVKGVHDNGTVKHTVTTVTKTTIIQEVEEPAGAPRPGESETWASDLDTSQVSVSSLPEDERTEPTLSSSATTATADAEALSGPLARTQVEEKEWTETDPDSGEVRHIISKTTHTTVTSKKPSEGAPRGDTTSTTVSHSSKDGHHGSTPSAPSECDEAESLTFFQKKEFFEKLSEQSPPKETSSARLGSTPSLDTALTRPAVTLKPRPRSESLTSQGEIIEESIVFAERLRLFQNGAQASPLPSASIPQVDLVDPAPKMEQKLQGMAEIGDSLQQVPSAVLEGLQSTEEKSDTRLLVHTSDADKEAFDVRSVQVAEDFGDKQFSHMRVRMPAPEETVSKTSICSSDLPGDKPSPLRDAYKGSLSASRQESSQAGKPPLPSALGGDSSLCLVHEATTDLTLSKAGPPNQTNKDITTFDRQPVREQSPTLRSSQSQMLASGLQMGIVAGSGILQEGIKASPQSAILETFSSSATEMTGLESPEIRGLPSEEVHAGSAEEAKGIDAGRIGAVLAAAPVAILPVRDIISGKQLEMLDIAQVSDEPNIFEGCVELPSQAESQTCPKEKTIMKTEYADIQHKLSSAFGESLAPVESKSGVTQGVPKEVLEALDRSSQELIASKLDEDSERDTNILSATQGSIPHDVFPDHIESTLDNSAAVPMRGAYSTPSSTAVCLTPERLEIQATREVAEERQEKPEVLVALEAYRKSTLRRSGEDSYDRNLEEFITVLEEYEPLPAGQLSDWKRASPAFEPSICHNSEITSKLPPLEDKKELETVGSILDPSENVSELLGNHAQSQMLCEDTGLLTDELGRTAGHYVISTAESDRGECLPTLSEQAPGKEREECLNYDSALGVRSTSGLESSLLEESHEERSLDLARSEDEQPSLVEDSMNVPTESSVIDYQVVGHSGVVKDAQTQPKDSDFDLHEISRTGDKTDLPLSCGDDGKKSAEFSKTVSGIAADMVIKDTDSEHLSQDMLHPTASTVLCEGRSDVPYSSDEDQHKELSRYKEVELVIPFLRGTSSSLEDEVEDGGSFSSGDLQAEKIAEFLTTDPDTLNKVVHFPQIFQDYDTSAHQEPFVPTETEMNVEKHVGFVLDEMAACSTPCVPLKSDRQTEIEEASRIVESVVHIASSLVESLHEVNHETAIKEDICDSALAYAAGSPLERSEVSETLSQAGPPSTIEKDQRESPFGVKEMYQVLKESRGSEDRIQYSVTSFGDPLFADEGDEDQERRRRGSPTAESLDDQAQIEKCSHEVMMQLLDGFSQSDVELAEVRTEDEAPDIEDDVPSPEAGSHEEKSVPSSQDNSGDLQPQLSTEVEIGSQASGAPAPLSELDYELCPDADQLRTSGDEAVATRVPPLEPERDEAVAESSHAPSAAADPAASAGRNAGGRERSPLLEASPPEETAYCPEQDISPAQEYPEYLTPDMQVRVGVSPTEAQPAKEKPVRYSESSVESSSEVGSPCPPSQGGTAMAFENVAFAGEDVIDATSSPIEESSSPAGSRSPYEVVRDAHAEEAAQTALVEAEKSLRHAVQEEVRARPQSLVTEESSEQQEHQIQPSIFNEAFDHSPEESAPEKKQLSEGLLGVGLLTVSDTTARTPESRRGDSDEDEEEWADHVMSKIRGRPIPPTPPASPRAVQSAVEVQGEPWEAPVVEQERVNVESARDMSAERDAGVDVMGDRSATQPQLQEFRRTADGKRPQLEHIPSEISDEDLVEREQSPTHITATCRGDRKDSSSDRNSSPDSDGPKASGSHRRSASGVGAIALEAVHSQDSGGNEKHSHESRDKGAQEDDKITEEPVDTMFVIEEEAPADSNRSESFCDDADERAARTAGGLSPSLESPPQKKDLDDGSSSGKPDAASPVVLRSKSKRTDKISDKRSSRDLDTGHSGSETDHSHYYSFELTSDSGKTPGASRPTSSEFDVNILSGQASSEYETCATSQDGEVSGSYATAAASSHDTSFATARSSLSGSSRSSAYSVDSESSGHLGSMEVSEASETIVASAHEELDSDIESERSKSVLREPYDGEIPESVIRGGVEHPFLPSWQPALKDSSPTLHGSAGARPPTAEGVFSPFQSTVPSEPGRSCVGWPSSSLSTAESVRSPSKPEVLNGVSAPLEGQRRLRHNDDFMASSHEEEQLSVSESSATQSEHTWQTSVETMVDAVEAQRFSCDSERHHRQSTMQNSVSLPFDEAVVAEDSHREADDDRATPPFQEVNGPVEVEYVPEYDDLTARTLRPVRQQNAPDGQTEAQGDVALLEASAGDASTSREQHEEENSTELREEGFYAETFQGDLSSEEVESAANEALLLDKSACSFYEYCHAKDEYEVCNTRPAVESASLKEAFERPATPEPVDEIDDQEDEGNLAQGSPNLHGKDYEAFGHASAEESVPCSDKTHIAQELSENDQYKVFSDSGNQSSLHDETRSKSVSSSLERAMTDDVRLYTSKCEDYILQMHQTYKYGVGLPKTSDGGYLPEEGMDVENVKLLESRLQEGNGGQQDFPYDLSYQQEYGGDGRVEHGDLYTHQEVEEEGYDDERSRTRGRRRLSPISDERGSTPDYDTLAGRKTFGKGSEKDDASTSSLMEFERLEAEMASGTKSSSVGSSDSLSGRQHQGRSGAGSEQDSVSVNSLTEFERLEKEIVEAEGVDARLRGEVAAKLDEIDEGHESQASDPGHETAVYDESGATLLLCASADVNEEPDGTTDDAQLGDIEAAQGQEVAWSRTERHFLTTRTESGHSVESVDRQSSASTATQFDADSLREREIDDSESNFGPDTPGWMQKECVDLDSLHDSLHDSEHHDSLQEVPSKDKDSLQLREPSADADSLQEDHNELQDSLYETRDIDWDSFRADETSGLDDTSRSWHQFPSQIRTTELSPTLSRPASSPLVVPVVVERIDTLTWVDQDPAKACVSDGESLGSRQQEHPRNDALVSSTDSLEPSSSANTHATYQCDTDSMMSSLNSAEESTMVTSTDTLEHETLCLASQGKSLSLEGGLFSGGDVTEEQNTRTPLEGGVSVDDMEERFRECLLRSAASPTNEEQVEERQTMDEKGNLIVTRTVKRHVTSEPRLHTQTFMGPDAEQRSREFVASFAAMEPSAERDEYEGFDAAGNTVRVTQHVVVRPTIKTVTFTGPDARLQMREYMRSLAGGQHSSAENTPTSDSGVGACSSLASPPPLMPDPPAAAPSSACPGLQRLSGGDQWMEAESALDDCSPPVTATRVITTRTTRTMGPDGREQLVTTTTEESGGEEPEARLRRSMQGVLDSFMAEPPTPPHLDEEE
ncbi:uncharacterized protein LOC144114148 isoform X27 [Amblyomma americanum]